LSCLKLLISKVGVLRNSFAQELQVSEEEPDCTSGIVIFNSCSSVSLVLFFIKGANNDGFFITFLTTLVAVLKKFFTFQIIPI
jgi:hypothetical protein